MLTDKLIDNIESKIYESESNDKGITQTIETARYYLSGFFMNDVVKGKFTDYIYEYSKSHYFKMNNSAFDFAIKSDDERRKPYIQRGQKASAIFAGVLGEALLIYFGGLHNPIGVYTSWMVGTISAFAGMAIESHTKFFSRKFYRMPGRENVLGSNDYNNRLRTNLMNDITAYYAGTKPLLLEKIEN